MRRWLAGLAVVVAAAAAVVTLTSASDTEAPSVAQGPSVLQTVRFDPLGKPVPVPKAKFTRTIYATSSLARSELMLDFCRGPIAVDVGDHRPVLVAEHDYCGGLDWMPKLAVGEAIKLSGGGVEDGIYVVKTIENGLRGKTRVSELPDADIVLQTCVTTDKTVLVAMDLFDPAAVA